MNWAKLFVAASLAILSSTGPAAALNDDKLNRQLLKLDPATRLEQTCDTEVMIRINKEHADFSVDKVIAYTFTQPSAGKNSLKAPGAVLRSHGDWYRLSFYCETGPKHLDAQKLAYRIGAKIPQEQWEQYYLYD